MLEKNLKHYRLMRAYSKRDLAEMIGVTPMAISHYEKGERMPDMETLKKIAAALNVRMSDLLSSGKKDLNIVHNEFRKTSALSKTAQEYVHSCAEEYLNRFAIIIEVLGDSVLPRVPDIKALNITGQVEIDAQNLRKQLGFAENGPIEKLIGQLENKGFLLYLVNIQNDKFSGINGTMDGRPYIMVNKNMNAERIRSTIIHELAHIMFNWDTVSWTDQDIEQYATAVSGAFLFPKEDAVRELGPRRSSVSGDMTYIAQEFGISMMMLVTRAQKLGIVSGGVAKSFFINASRWGWKKNEPSRINAEDSFLFQQLVYRAVNEEEISVSRGSELLKIPYQSVLRNCSITEEDE